MITVFTPTYNRRKLLERLYQSLKNQTSFDFEWVIVDDGSVDDTEKFIRSLPQDKFPIRLFLQENSGKHSAINKGAEVAKGEWFFIVDSDDYLLPKAIETLNQLTSSIENDSHICCVCTNRIYEDGSSNGNEVKYDVLDTNFIDYSFKYGYTGEKPPCMRTSVWREFPFPVFKGEKFCNEALVLRRIAKKYTNRYFNKCVYVMEGYLEDGLTQNLKSHSSQSPSYSTLFFKEQLEIPGISIKTRIITYYLYWHYFKMCPKITSDLLPTVQLRLIGYPMFLFGAIVKKIRQK